MIEIKAKGVIKNETLMMMEEEHAEDFLNKEITNQMGLQILEKLEDMEFLEMRQNSEQDAIEWEANIIICAKEQIISSVGIMAQRLVQRFGAAAKDIEYCLEPAVTDMKGF